MFLGYDIQKNAMEMMSPWQPVNICHHRDIKSVNIFYSKISDFSYDSTMLPDD